MEDNVLPTEEPVIDEFFAMTDHALLRVCDGGVNGPNKPYIETIRAVVDYLGIFDVRVQVQGGTHAALTPTGIVLYDPSLQEPLDPDLSKFSRPEFRSADLRGLFLNQAEAISGYERMTRSISSRRRVKGFIDDGSLMETMRTITVIGLDHKTFRLAPVLSELAELVT